MLTPLLCIISYAKSLSNELKHSAKVKEADLIFITAQLLFSLTNELIDRAIVGGNSSGPHYQLSPLNRIVEDAVEIITPLAETKGITLNLVLLPTECAVALDRERVQ